MRLFRVPKTTGRMIYRGAVLATIIVAFAAVVSCQRPPLPCSSSLRLSERFRHLFAHCVACTYSQWSDWAVIRTVNVPIAQCESGKSLHERRTRSVITGTPCTDTTENRNICEPTLIDQLVLGLGLGSRGQDVDSTSNKLRPRPPIAGLPYVLNGTSPLDNLRGKRSGPECSAKQICHHVTTPHGKRSVLEEKARNSVRNRRAAANNPEPEPLPENPIPFNIAEHGARYRRQQQNCHPDGIQHVLFILDTSGSVPETTFNQVTAVLGELVTFFCRPIRIAVMTFDHEYFVEFCFNCHDNTCSGRAAAGAAMANIDYDFSRSGTRYTHTGGAAKCVCDFMLSTTCGLPTTANCVDVVFLTDGRSNDPNRNVCNEIRCLHSRFGVNTFAIGVGNVNPTEIQCISDADPGEYHLFNFPNFPTFLNVFNELVNILLSGATDLYGDPYVCIGTQNLGTQPCSR